jgi:hypothetical protein
MSERSELIIITVRHRAAAERSLVHRPSATVDIHAESVHQ